MTLDWTFSLISVDRETGSNTEISLICSFRDGKLLFSATPTTNRTIIEQMATVMPLLTYIAFFPNKNFVKIKLKTPENQFAIHFLDKRFLDQNLLGIFSVSEFDVETPFEFWGTEEMMSDYMFENYRDFILDENPSIKTQVEYLEWLKFQVSDFYQDWQDENKTRSKRGIIKTFMTNTAEKTLEQMWDLQIMNESGLPVIDMINFIDNNAFIYMDEQEQVSQSLESMSLSALKILIDQTKGSWNIQYLKLKLGNEMGYQYLFFKQFSVKEINYLLVMNSSIYDYIKEKCLQMFRGNEFPLLNLIASKTKLSPGLFQSNGLLIGIKEEEILRKIILDAVERVFE
jgi:hypothetical protein